MNTSVEHTSIQISMWLVGSKEDSFSFLQTEVVKEKHSVASNVAGILVIES